MKKLLILGIIILAVAVAAVWFIGNRQAPIDVAAYLPARTLALVEASHLHRSAARWPQSSIALLLNDPEVQAVLSGTKSAFWEDERFAEAMGHWDKVKPAQIFAALMETEDGTVQPLLGIRFDGPRSLVQLGLRRMRETLVAEGSPEAETVKIDRLEFTTQPVGGILLHTAHHKNWVLFSLASETLGDFCQNLASGGADNSLADLAEYQEVEQQLDPERELMAFLQVGATLDRILALGAQFGATPDLRQVEWLRTARAIGFSSRLNGRNIEEQIFILTSTPPAPQVIEELGLPLARPETVMLFEHAVDPTSFDWQGILTSLPPALQQEMAERGIDPAAMAAIVGGDLSVLINWQENALIPGVNVVLSLQDREQAEIWVEKLLAETGQDIIKTPGEDVTVFSIGTPGSLGFISPTIALREDRIIGSLQAQDLQAMLESDPQSGQAALMQHAPLYASGLSGFDFIDLPVILERAYRTFRPALMFGAAMLPGVTEYANLDKLPESTNFTRHLGPVIGTQRNLPTGYLLETSGPVTLNHLAILGLTGGISALPAVAIP